jgi:hypothetical protein
MNAGVVAFAVLLAIVILAPGFVVSTNGSNYAEDELVEPEPTEDETSGSGPAEGNSANVTTVYTMNKKCETNACDE